MTTKLKSQEAAEHVQSMLDAFHLAGSQNARFRSELATLRAKVSTLEVMLNQKEKRLILLTELLSRRQEAPRLPEVIETETSTVE